MTRRERATARAHVDTAYLRAPNYERFADSVIDAYEAELADDLESEETVERACEAFYYFGDGTETIELSLEGRMQRALRTVLGSE